VVHVLNGAFLDRRVLFGFLGAIDLARQAAVLWGDGEQPMDFTTYEDTARYTAEAALDERPVPRVLSVAGDVLTFHELVAQYEAGSGKRLNVEHRGALEDLDARIAHLQRTAPGKLFAFMPLMYWRAMLSGRGKLDDLINGSYPAIRPTRVSEYVARAPLTESPPTWRAGAALRPGYGVRKAARPNHPCQPSKKSHSRASLSRMTPRKLIVGFSGTDSPALRQPQTRTGCKRYCARPPASCWPPIGTAGQAGRPLGGRCRADRRHQIGRASPARPGAHWRAGNPSEPRAVVVTVDFT
jgi:hypothetical protein